MKTFDRKSYVVRFANFMDSLLPSSLHPRIKFSHQVNSKPNRKVSDATIYSTRNKVEKKVVKGKENTIVNKMIIGKIKDIYTYEGYEEYKKRKDNLLIKEIDPRSFEILEQIASKYPAFKEIQLEDGKTKRIDYSPFKSYIEDNDIPGIQKNSRRGKGPIIRSLKYYDKKLGSHINITKDINGNLIDKTANGRSVVLLSLNPWRTDVYYSAKDSQFKLVGIKYNHLKFENGLYGVPKEVYYELTEKEGITLEDEFRFSLYRKDMVEFSDSEQIQVGLFHSRTNEAKKNYFEMKPIDSNKWIEGEEIPIFGQIAKGGRFVKSIKKNVVIRKIYTDILGNRHYIDKEELKDII